MDSQKRKLVMGFFVLALTTMIVSNVKAWTGEIHGRVVCDVCGDSSIGPEDHVLEGFCLWLAIFDGVIEGGGLDDILRFYYLKASFCLFQSLLCAEVAVLCITKSGEVLNYQAFTNAKGMYTVAETMPESDRWDACLARPISSFHEHCTHLGGGSAGVKFTYNHPSGYFHTVKPFVYRHGSIPTYCM
ncbi:hypothetical protein Pint_04177 [Pistacia integerrima]|uniref:Uncharacterized protein n=1 Tax=Pistacia integerrima TaxID=434235 RepID=A0ACC0Z8F5_9ROSI|nr:hypothetical protein Pint_04177 [Pistacia integerrima]